MVFVIHWHESAMDLHVFPIQIPPPTSLSTRSLWVFPVHQAWALVSCIQPGLVICFTIDNIHVSILFSLNIPPSPSPTESKSIHFFNIYIYIIWKDTCIPMLIAALFTITRTWKQPKCPSMEEWVKKMWYMYIMEYYSAIKYLLQWHGCT